MQRFLHLTRQPIHPAPHVGMAGCDPHPNAGRQPDHRATTALMTAHASSAGVVTGMRTRMSAPSATSTAAASASGFSPAGGDTTTSAKPATALQSSGASDKSVRYRYLCAERPRSPMHRAQTPPQQSPASALRSTAGAVQARTSLPRGSSHRPLHRCKARRLHQCQNKARQFRARKAAPIGRLRSYSWLKISGRGLPAPGRLSKAPFPWRHGFARRSTSPRACPRRLMLRHGAPSPLSGCFGQHQHEQHRPACAVNVLTLQSVALPTKEGNFRRPGRNSVEERGCGRLWQRAHGAPPAGDGRLSPAWRRPAGVPRRHSTRASAPECSRQRSMLRGGTSGYRSLHPGYGSGRRREAWIALLRLILRPAAGPRLRARDLHCERPGKTEAGEVEPDGAAAKAARGREEAQWTISPRTAANYPIAASRG